MGCFGLVGDNIHPKLLWKFHQNPTCFGSFKEDLQLVLFGKVWFGMVYQKLLWKLYQDPTCFCCFREYFELFWFCLVWDNIHAKLLWKFHQNLTCFGCFREDFELVCLSMEWIGMVWLDLRQHPSEDSVEVSSRSDLFLLF